MEFGRNRERLQFFKVCLCTCGPSVVFWLFKELALFVYQCSGLDDKLNVIIWKGQTLKCEFNMGTENWLITWFMSLKFVRQQRF